MRSHGKCRFVTISKRMQMIAAGSTVAIAGACLFALGSLVQGQYHTSEVHAALLDREARIASTEGRIEEYRDELDAATLQLERRQAFIEQMVEMLPADLLEADGEAQAAGDVAAEDQPQLGRISADLPEAADLTRVEQRQLAAVAALTRFAENRAERAEDAIRKLGLDPRGVLAAAQGAMGGPLEPLATEADGSLDPRFERLSTSLSRMAALEQGLDRIPQVMPTALARMTSNFGIRRDPFTGAGAMHSGLDFGGRTGDPIRAAAAGKVSFAGYRSGYGKVVEITHGNGLMTRYAHMSAFKAKRGEAVRAGQVIGAIGSTGRSTGPHLHFEVRLGDRAINPRPFLESAPDLLEEIRS